MAICTGIEATVQPGARDLPVALDRRARGALGVRDVVEGQPAEKSQLHHAALARIERRQLGQRRVQIEEVDVWRVVVRDGAVERQARPSAGPFGHLAPPGVIYQDPAHHLGRQGEEMRSILPIGVPLVDESEVRLVDQRRRLQQVPRLFVPESGRRPAAQLLVDDGDERVTRGEIPSAPRVEQSRHIVS